MYINLKLLYYKVMKKEQIISMIDSKIELITIMEEDSGEDYSKNVWDLKRLKRDIQSGKSLSTKQNELLGELVQEQLYLSA